MKTIIAGSRTISDYGLVYKAILESGFQITEVVSGGNMKWDIEKNTMGGVDYLGEIYAIRHSIPVKPFYAKWDAFGRAAGPIRNQEMADYAEALIAIWDEESRGTRDMIDRATQKGLKVYVHNTSLDQKESDAWYPV